MDEYEESVRYFYTYMLYPNNFKVNLLEFYEKGIAVVSYVNLEQKRTEYSKILHGENEIRGVIDDLLKSPDTINKEGILRVLNE